MILSYQKRDGFDESALKIEILSPTKTTITPEIFFKGAARKNVGDTPDAFNVRFLFILFNKIYSIIKTNVRILCFNI